MAYGYRKPTPPLTPAVFHILLALSSGERRIYHQITGVGARALAAELERYKHIVNLAQERKLYPRTFAHDV